MGEIGNVLGSIVSKEIQKSVPEILDNLYRSQYKHFKFGTSPAGGGIAVYVQVIDA